MAGGGGGGEGEPEFQIAPMIDVLLTLLIFFMSITTAQVEALDKDIKLPIAPDAKERKKNDSQMIVNVKWRPGEQKSVMVLDGITYEDIEELKTAIESKRTGIEQRRGQGAAEVLIRGDKELPAKEIQKVMQTAGAAGVDSISFSTFNQ